MYLLDFEEGSASSRELAKDVENFIAKGKYELLMEVKEEGENGQTTFISITGNLSEEALNKAIAAAMAE